MGAGLRAAAKAAELPPDPTIGAPALDPTAERRLETELWEGLRHRHCAKAAGTSDSPFPTATAPVVDSTGEAQPSERGGCLSLHMPRNES
jgi:hypothetical protein